MQIEVFLRHPVETQLEVLDGLLEKGRLTRFGREHHFSDIHTVRDFQERVPIQKYEGLYPFIERSLRGERDVLWPGKVRYFSKSSGTTNDRSKFIPVTEESLEECHFKAGKDMLAVYLDNVEESKLFTGKAISIGGSLQQNHLNEGSWYGDLSAVLIERLPFFFEMFRSPSKKTALLPSWEEKLGAMAQEVSLENIGSMAGVPTWTYLLLQEVLKVRGKTNISEIWPSLEVYFHGGVHFGPYRDQFRELIGNPRMRYLEVYNASEGFLGLQQDLSRDDLLLMLDYGIFYEFVPLEHADDPHTRAYTLDEVEPGKVYSVVISTNGGLWRYQIGDTVRFTSTYPFRIRIAGRTKQFINTFGEELMVENVELAMAEACNATGARVFEYTAGPVYFEKGQPGGHEWIIEFEKAPEHPEAFFQDLDSALRRINSDYDAKRNADMALRFPVFHLAPEGTFYLWMRSRGKLGAQHKVPRLSNDRIHLESILAQMTSA